MYLTNCQSSSYELLAYYSHFKVNVYSSFINIAIKLLWVKHVLMNVGSQLVNCVKPTQDNAEI